VKKRPLGRTRIQVSSLCLGAMYFGTRTDAATSFDLLDQYVKAGGSFIDTANIYAHWIPGYTGGESEALLGRWMKERGNRHELFIATKVGFELPGVERGLRPDQIESECEKSLRRLGVDSVDLYYAHVDDRETRLEETMAAFARLVEAGKVRFIGASNFRAWRLEQANWVSRSHGWPEYCCIQQRYSYLRPRPGTSFAPQLVANEDLLDVCHYEQLTLLAYSVLLGGAYTRPERPLPEQYTGPDSQARRAVLKAVARETGATPNQVILAWMMQGTPSILPLIAASSSQQLQENLGALDITLSDEQWQRLNEAGAG
jgi:aryl-alcohol dehydrogenase-like predicted oxidoreductase